MRRSIAPKYILSLLKKSFLLHVEPAPCSINGHQGVRDQIGVPVAVMAVVVAVVPLQPRYHWNYALSQINAPPSDSHRRQSRHHA